jgi:DNA-binding response OmpR family regulator
VLILLIEDEDRIASFMKRGLEAEGHTVERARDGAEGVGLALARDFDVLLLDLVLPDAHGKDVLRRVREARPDLPIVVVSALDEVDEKVELLDLGADDYITKPFAFAELTARVRAATRQGRSSSRVLSAGGVSLDTATRVATRGEVTVELPSREFSLLEYLLRHAGQVLSRQQLLDAVWGFDFEPGSNVVDVYVGYLRRKLDGADGPSVIETVRGAGYRARS